MQPVAVNFLARDGVPLEGLLHLPAERGARPGVVISHSHSRQAGGHMYAHVLRIMAEQLAQNGFAALRFNFRGVQGSGGAFDDGRGELHDVGGAVDFLRARADVDAEQIALAAYSFGSRVIVPYAAGDARIKAVATLGMPAHRFLKTPLRLAMPMLLLIGDADTRTPPHYVQQFAAQQPAATVQLLPGADHSYRGHEQAIAGALVAFLKTHRQNAKL